MIGSPIRRCPDCGEEFQPHVVQCSDCGAPLESVFEGDPLLEQRAEATGAAPAPAELALLVRGLTPGEADQAAQHLAAAGIPIRLALDRDGLRLGVAREQLVPARSILGRAGVLPEQPDAAEGAVAEEGGPCPACGDHVAPGTAECAGCGLQLAGAFQCPRCGTELLTPSEACPACAPPAD